MSHRAGHESEYREAMLDGVMLGLVNSLGLVGATLFMTGCTLVAFWLMGYGA